ATLRVVGLSASAENCPHPLCGPTTLYVGPGALRALRLAPSSSPGQLQLAVALRSADSSSAGVHALRDAISRALPPGSVVAGNASTDTRRFSNLGYAFQAGVFLAFSIVALAAAGSLILVTLGAAVRSDSRRIGLLKAVGFTARQLRLTVLAEYAGIAIAAGGSGSLIAAAAAPRLFASVVGQYGPGGVRSQWVDAGLALTVVAVLASVITLVASRRAVRIDAVSALRQEVGAGARPTGIVHGPVVVSRAVSDLRTRRARSLLTTTALGLAAFTTAFALIIFSGFGVFFRQIGIGGARQGDVVVATPSQIPPGSVESVLRRQPGVAALVREENTTFTFPDSTETMVLRLRSGDTEALALPLVTGRQPRLPGEALVGFGLARQRHLRPGDHMVVSVAGVPGELSVVGINRDATNLGRTVAILAATLPQAHHFFPPLYYLRPRAGMAAERVAAGIRRQSGGTLDPVVFDARVLPASIRDVGPVLGALVLALGLLTGLGVLNSVMLGVQERRREIGILRTLGMRTSEIVGSVLTGAGGLALLGSAAALPLAVVAARAAFGAIGRGTGVGALNVGVPTSVAAVPAIAVAIGLVGAALPAWVASSTSVTAVLRED
ncbi:MAG TPA: ABC transporter permease, partial [Acidimicrobiales bacterium]|nr:ABC transporter permease [Acidimicrobiales bacterium]